MKKINKNELNQMVVEKLRAMDLSPEALRAVEGTPINFMHEVFGHIETAEQMEQYVKEMNDIDD